MNYYEQISQIICEYYERTDILNSLFEKAEDKNDYITKMKTD